jgi:hypothetical protein
MPQEAVEGGLVLRGVTQTRVVLDDPKNAESLLQRLVELLPGVSGDVGDDHGASRRRHHLNQRSTLAARFVALEGPHPQRSWDPTLPVPGQVGEGADAPLSEMLIGIINEPPALAL